jgi:hypothetical protein
MTCPDYDDLVDFYHGQVLDPEVEKHLTTCPTCRTDLAILDLVSAAWEPDTEMPEGLIERALASLPARQPVTTLAERLRWAVLAPVTAACGLVAMGALGVDPVAPAVVLVATSVTGWLVRPRWERPFAARS